MSPSERINLRTTFATKALIKQAEALVGCNVSTFVLENAYEAASRVVARQDILTLSNLDRDVILNVLENPPEPTPVLIDLMRITP